ncbi:hypothetical protein IWX62_003148 [Arthrobacter sp. CAN_A1]
MEQTRTPSTEMLEEKAYSDREQTLGLIALAGHATRSLTDSINVP